MELRAPNEGSEIIATIIFEGRPSSQRSPKQVEEDIVRQARHILRHAASAAD
jgi:hypothetical protein